MARHRLIFIAVACVALVACVWHWLYSHSTLAEAAPLQALREHLDPETADIGSDLVDGFWVLDFHGPNATDQVIRNALPYLTALPTHTPIDALDYDRSFRVRLTDTVITDEGVELLNELPLSQFVAINTPLSDASLDTLEGQSRLNWIYLSGTDVSAERRQQYSKAHPRCAVIDAKDAKGSVAEFMFGGEVVEK